MRFDILNSYRNRVLKAGIIGLLAAGIGFAAHPKLSPELEGVDAQRQVDVIITFTQSPTFAHHAKILMRGGTVRRSLEVVKAGAYRLTAAKLAELADDPDVEYISPDHAVQGLLQFAEPTVNANIALQHGYRSEEHRVGKECRSR